MMKAGNSIDVSDSLSEKYRTVVKNVVSVVKLQNVQCMSSHHVTTATPQVGYNLL